jgi:transposase
VLVPVLRPDDIAVLDNLASHKAAGVRQAIEAARPSKRPGHRSGRAIEAAGAQPLYLPPYSPDPNPVEPLFAKFEAKLRARAERTAAALRDALGELAASLTPTECANYLRNSGYFQSA